MSPSPAALASTALAPTDVGATPAFLERLFILTKTVSTLGGQHPSALENAVAAREALAHAGPPFALQFVREATFRDRTLVSLDLEGFHRCQVLSKALSHCGVQELSFDRVPEVSALLRLSQILARGAQGPTDWLEHETLGGVSWREIAGAGWGAAARSIDPDLFAVTQVSLAIAETELLAADPRAPWRWPAGVGVVRRLERALDVDSNAADRALELAPAPWSPARRAVAVALRVVAVLREVGALAGTVRAAGHAALVIGVAGIRPGATATLEQAAGDGLARLLATAMDSASGGARHRIRVCALLHAIHKRTAFHGRWVGAIGLVDILYALEQRRQRPGQTAQLTLSDLLAEALADVSGRFDAAWLRAIVATVGELPPGARVRLADGRLGVVLEPGPSGQAWRPLVLIAGVVVEPQQPVRLQAVALATGGQGVGASG